MSKTYMMQIPETDTQGIGAYLKKIQNSKLLPDSVKSIPNQKP